MAELTPMMKQYLEIKKNNPDSILFFRLGDFYEMFSDDARTASKDNNAALVQVADRTGTNIGLCHRFHLDGSLHADIHTFLLQHIGNRQCVDAGSKHTHMICTHTDHLIAAVLQTTPEVAAAHNDTDLHTHCNSLLDHVADLTDHIKIKTAVCRSGQRFAADLQQYPLVLRLVHSP